MTLLKLANILKTQMPFLEIFYKKDSSKSQKLDCSLFSLTKKIDFSIRKKNEDKFEINYEGAILQTKNVKITKKGLHIWNIELDNALIIIPYM